MASVTVVHSSAPKRDLEVFKAILPDRFQNEEEVSTQEIFSLAAPSGRFREECSERILVLRAPNASSAGKTVVVDEQEFETVSLTNHATSFASLVLKNQEELKSMGKLASEQEGLVFEEYRIQAPKSKHVVLGKLLLPGGCLVTLSTSQAWMTDRTKVLEFMVSPISGAGKSGGTKPSTMRRSVSMPEMVPPTTVTTSTSTTHSRKIRSLRTTALSFDGKYTDFPLNSEEPIPVETELFVGKFLLVCRPSEDPATVDPYWNERIFSKKKRRIVMQLQGKFKYKPTGTIYAGMEISDTMKLGLIANSLCNLILKMVTKSFNPAMHYSFGNKNELPHISFPASTFWDTLVVTPPGEAPPKMGDLNLEGEPPEVAKARQAYKTKIDWNTQDTYSMSFHSMYIDFSTWSVVSLPIGRDVPLQTFWGNSSASIVLYETDQNTHQFKNNKYIIGARFENLGKDGADFNTPLQSQATQVPSSALLIEDNEEDDDTSSEHASGEESISTLGDVALMPAFDEDDDIDDTEFFDTMEHLPEGITSPSTLPELSSSTSHHALLGTIDSFCPCWIEMFSKRGKYSMVYAFCGRGGLRADSNETSNALFFRTSEMAERIFFRKGHREDNAAAEVDDRFSHRISSHERMRRILGLKYAQLHTSKELKDRRRINHFHKLPCRFDAKFLRRNERTTNKLIGSRSGLVARAISDRHWKEERMVLADNTCELLFHHIDGSKIHFRISLSSVIHVSIPNEDSKLPLPDFYYIQIETNVHVTYIMLRTKEERNSWIQTLNTMLNDRRAERSFTNEVFHFEDPIHEFLSKSTMWNCQKRKILNCRRYNFHTTSSKTPEETLVLAEAALAKVLSLKPKGTNDTELREFLDCAAALKGADAHSLNDDEKCAFFVNVYHTMIMHSYIILGPPSTGGEWVSYFNNIAYQCSDDIFSLAELEHNIIRAQMSYPSNFLSRFVLPKSQYHFALVRSDFRLNFALNPGALSTPTSAVPIYKGQTLNQQLNSVTQEFVGYAVQIKTRGNDDVQITLPRVCQWFAEDFGPNASASDVLFAVEPYLSDPKREVLRTIWNRKKKTYEIGIFGLKYHAFNYECRFLTASTE